ncbi:DNA primase [uncultured Caudovirales phage]|uniref:DNA primase n=1 Tax=uncultured Caudovirales phage TaxID=2100421 RepID=A0A6J5NS26_9CAUD|nr:DNA primase [uncultured Caudovirales phage]
MSWLEAKYIGIVSTKLRNFKRKGPKLWNFSCSFCGDSSKSKSKARAYIYEKSGKLNFHCHNCSATMGAANFIKMLDQNAYNDMQLERLQDKKTPAQIEYEEFVEKMKKPVFLKSGPLKGLKKVSQLSPNDRVKLFVAGRKIPNPYHAKLFSCPNFKTFTNNLVSDKFDKESLIRDETRLLIPFFDKDKNLHAYQGRAIGNSAVKYITIILNDNVPKIYGLDTVNLNKTTYVFEGPIDSMFIPNSIATAGGDLVSSLIGFSKDNLVIVYDNEPRNKDTIKKLDKAILSGYNACIWPENLEHKDVNDMVLAGMSPEFIEYIIKHNTYRDLAAKLALTKWSKI